MPALNAAKRKATAISCLGNLKQIGSLHISYLNDFRGYFLFQYGTGDLVGMKLLMEIYDPSKKLQTQDNGKASGHEKILYCPELPMRNAGALVSTYGFAFPKWWSGQSSWTLPEKWSININNSKAFAVNFNLARQATATPVFGDAVVPEDGIMKASYQLAGTGSFSHGFSDVHAKRGNILFTDGHAAGTSPKEWAADLRKVHENQSLEVKYIQYGSGVPQAM